MAEKETTGRENRYHIGIYGATNAGKSSLMNRLTGQSPSIVSPLAGTTTDPVRKGVELPGVGPCLLIDTAGLDDTSPLGQARVQATLETLHRVDLALFVEVFPPAADGVKADFMQRAARARVPVLHVQNLWEGVAERPMPPISTRGVRSITVNAREGHGLESLLAEIAREAQKQQTPPPLFEGLISPGDSLLMVVPIDAGAPQGRLILPQVQALRAALDAHAIPSLVRPQELPAALRTLEGRVKLVVTDSQIFSQVAAMVPEPIGLTSFSMLLARQKGPFPLYLEGTPRLATLRAGDRVLIVEGCSHHASCDDIGRVKIPALLARVAKGPVEAHFVNGDEALPDGLSDYRIALLCGGCMNTPRQLQGRALRLVEAGVPITNYGMAIAFMQGIYARAIAPFQRP